MHYIFFFSHCLLQYLKHTYTLRPFDLLREMPYFLYVFILKKHVYFNIQN